jgi:hypothetical protein
MVIADGCVTSHPGSAAVVAMIKTIARAPIRLPEGDRSPTCCLMAATSEAAGRD